MLTNNGVNNLIAFSLVAAYIFSSCSPAATVIAPTTVKASTSPLNPTGSGSEPATSTPAATLTPAPTPTETSLATTAATQSASPTSQTAAEVIPTLNAFCRKGPGTSYVQITFLLKGDSYDVIGRDSLNLWWLVKAPGEVSCWVGDANVIRQGPVEQAGIVQGHPLPATPAQFVNSYECNTALKTLGVSFNWASVDGATGYRIYRDGSPLVEVMATMTSYHDKAPLGEDLIYEMEAFNDYGSSARIATNVPACK